MFDKINEKFSIKNIAILTSPNQWFIPYANKLSEKIAGSMVFDDHTKIGKEFDIVFMLSYHRIVDKKYLNMHNHNIVIHASDLPQGKGWSPMFWQVLDGKKDIVFTMFEASTNIDDGDIYMKKTLNLIGNELNKELRMLEADIVIDMCLEFIGSYENIVDNKIIQSGKESFYKRRTPNDSVLNVNRTIAEQFNLFRIVDNEEYPAYFEYHGKKYILKIFES